MWAKVPRNFKSPNMNLYDGTTDPRHHLSNFKSRMYLADASDVTRYKAFPTTLTKSPMKWEICHTEKLPPPHPIKNKKGGSHTEYCEYHKLYRQSTNDCYDLKNVIEKLVKKGRLNKYLIERSDSQEKRKRDEKDTGRRDRSTQTPERHIHMIAGGFAEVGLTKSSRKRHLKEIYQVEEEILDSPTISFTKEDAQGIIPEHDDPVVITLILANANLHWTLMDQGSSADILFKPTFDKLGLEEKELKAYSDTLYGLGDTPIRPLSFIFLHTIFGKGMRSETLNIEYIVLVVASAYNALIG
ncbi:uncharacterized protein LOC107610784 [Arachis ipaensis]|uniref:uncharacterized protein LOC107610784 n=1 Tax=Arachis ipaensis TaxID=130454 RepID=UPI0007AF6B80|nr:uncharacterized protein LOC107610784 [Arachis ipaensis]XP_025670062.1 uncharacterized protein LOC112769812 [Arachis hypogaea]